ncbi:hypothetical protein BH10PSE4_BH10PSE4_27070 [soil metagenome]
MAQFSDTRDSAPLAAGRSFSGPDTSITHRRDTALLRPRTPWGGPIPDLAPGTPRYRQVQAYLVALIAAEPAGRLPTERDLSLIFGVSRPTIRKTLAVLQQDGLIARRRRVGTYALGPEDQRAA